MFEQISGFFSGFGEVFLGLFVFVIFLGFGIGTFFLFKNAKNYNKVVVIRTIIDGEKGSPIFDRAKRVKTEEGTYWKLKKLKLLLEAPPEKCIEATNTGKEFVQLFITQNDQPIWVRTKIDKKDIIYLNPKLPKNQMEEADFEYIDTIERQGWINQYKNSQKYGVGGLNAFLQKYGAIMATGTVMVLILGIFMFFFGDILIPIQDLSDGLVTASSNLKEVGRYCLEGTVNSVEVPN